MTTDPQRPGRTLQFIEDPLEQAQAAKFQERLQLVTHVVERWDKVAAVSIRANSELARDDHHTAWRNLSHMASGAINHAIDNLQAVSNLVVRDDSIRFPQVAHYALLRAALESGSLAVWLLAPDDPLDRIQRLLRCGARELQEEVTLTKRALAGYLEDPDIPVDRPLIDRSRKQMKAHRRKHADQISAVAKRLGLHDPTDDKWQVGFSEIVADATEHVGLKPYYGEITWRIISGLTHPSMMRSAARSNVQEIADNPDGSLHALVSTDLGLTLTALEAATLNTRHAVEIMATRKVKPADDLPPVSRTPSIGLISPGIGVRDGKERCVSA